MIKAVAAAQVNITQAELPAGSKGVRIHWVKYSDFSVAVGGDIGMTISQCQTADAGARTVLGFKGSTNEVTFDPPFTCVFSSAVPGTTDVVTIDQVGGAGTKTLVVCYTSF